MIRKTALALALGVAAIGAGSAAWAQYYDDDDYYGGGGWNGSMPPGSWQRTCTNARMSGPILRARCDNGSGRWTYTEIDVRRCGGRVQNSWGRLTCGGAGWGGDGYGYGWNGGRPRGNWEATCRDARMSGSVLYALCDDGNGRWRGTSIDVRQCRGDAIKNSWGRLACD